MLLKAIGIIPFVDSSIVWAVVVIVLGFTIKSGCCHRSMWMGKMMGKGEGHKCMGAGCPMCNKD